MIVNAGNLKTIFTGFKAAFISAFAAIAPSYTTLATVVPSSTREEEYGWIGKSIRMREWLGDRQIQNLKAHKYSIVNRDFEATIGVDRNDIEDDRFGLYSVQFAELGQAAAEFPDELVYGLLAAGFTTTGYDGQFFFDTDHPVYGADGVTATSVSNHGGGGGTPWYVLDCSRPIKPLIFQERKPFNLVSMDQADDEKVFNQKLFRHGVDGRCNVGFSLWQLGFGSKQTLDETNLQAAITAMKSLKGDHGKPLGIRPTHLIVPPALELAAEKLLTAVYGANGASNVMAGKLKLLSPAWLA